MRRFSPGDRFRDLIIDRELGRGAFGYVYLAHDALIDRHVAVKFIPGTLGEADVGDTARVLREARAVGSLSHPNIVTLFRVHSPDDQDLWAFEFEFVDGGTLHHRLVDGPALPPQEAVRIGECVLQGLAAAHEAGVVHSDVKPGNVLLGLDGSVKLADFGLARLLGDSSLRLTGTGDVIGTPLYMAPEVLMGDGPSPTSDVWSVATLLFRVCAGRHPFDIVNIHSLMYAIQTRAPAPLPDTVPPGLARVIHRGLARRPEDRPRDAVELLRLLKSAAVQDAAKVPLAGAAERHDLRGRASEAERLEVALRTAKSGGPGCCFLVTGAGGVGKSALIETAARTARREGFLWFEARTTEVEGLLLALLRSVSEESHAVDPASGSSRFESARDHVRKLLEETTDRRFGEDPRGISALEETLRALVVVGPTVVVVEDLQRGNADDIRTARHLAGRLPSLGVVLLVAARVEGPAKSELRALAADQGIELLSLESLKREDAYALLEDRVDGRRIAPGIEERIYEVAHGNPLFTLGYLQHLEQIGAVVRTESGLSPTELWDRAPLPQHFHELATLQLDGLSKEERDLVDVAAVGGFQFDGMSVAAILELPVLAALRRLQTLYRETGLVEPLERGFRFGTPLVQEVVYHELAPDLRGLLHRAHAEQLEAKRGRRDVEPELIAVHWERGGEPDRSAPYFLKASWRAMRRQEARRATDFAVRSGVRPGQVDPSFAYSESKLLLGLGGFYHDLGDDSGADATFDDVVRAAEAYGDDELRLRALTRRAEVDLRAKGASAVDLQALEQAAQDLPDGFDRVLAWKTLGVAAKYRGNLGEAEKHLRSANTVLSRYHHAGLQSTVLDQLGSISLRRGEFAAAARDYRKAARLAESDGRRANAAISRINFLLADFRRGALDGVAPLLEDAIHTLEIAGNADTAAQARLILAAVQYALGEPAGMAANLDRALGTLRKGRRPAALTSALQWKGTLAANQGDLDRAVAYFDEARQSQQVAGALEGRVRDLLWRVLYECYRGHPDRALEPALEARRVACSAEDREVHVTLLYGLAEAGLLGLALDRIDGLDELAPATADEPDGAAAHALLEVVRSWSGTSPGGLRGAAQLLREPGIGARRFEKRLLGRLLEGEAARRDGDASEAASVARRGQADAEQLGHVWYERFLQRLLDLHDPLSG